MSSSVNGVPLHAEHEVLDEATLRQRACTELLRQAAMRSGLLARDDPAPVDGAVSEAASAAIEQWLEQNLRLPEPTDEACRRYHAAHARKFQQGERVRMRHVLFAVTPGVDVVALRKRAEACLLDVRCHEGNNDAAFEEAARTLSNCPSGAHGGELGWVMAQECAPEMARELFGHAEVGVLPRLVHSRFGLHVVEILEREPGIDPPYAAVAGSVGQILRQQAWVTAVRQCMLLLAADAEVLGVSLERADSPLVQ